MIHTFGSIELSIFYIACWSTPRQACSFFWVQVADDPDWPRPSLMPSSFILCGPRASTRGGLGSGRGAQTLAGPFIVAPWLGDSLAASLPACSSSRGEGALPLTSQTLCHRITVERRMRAALAFWRRPDPSAAVERRWWENWPRLPTGSCPPCRSRLIRCRAAPSAPAPSARTTGSGSLRSAVHRWGGTAWSHRSWSSWRWRRGWGGSRPAWGSGGPRPGGATSGHCTVPADNNNNVRCCSDFQHVLWKGSSGPQRSWHLPVRRCRRRAERGSQPTTRSR